MYQRVKAYVEKYHMLQENDHVITGVSGGADSVCLLFMLKEFKNEMPLELTVVHIHHGIRGDSADADERYVKALCRQLGVRYLAFHENVEQYAKEQGLTLEEAGRNVRRQIFEKVCKEKNGTKIALAHHHLAVSARQKEIPSGISVRFSVCRDVRLKHFYRKRESVIVRMRRIWKITIRETGSGIM